MFGRYQITHKIAEGGMAEVYAAKHEHMGRTAAIKLLLPEMSARRDMVKRFFNEAQIAASLAHPGIVEVLDVGYTADGRAYLVMEMLAGEPMNERLQRTGAQPIRTVRLWMRQLAGAVGAAHARGIVHRDLKPGNLFLVPDPEVASGERIKVLDFGLAKLAEYAGSVLTAEGTVFGTPAYMAPEQCKNAAAVDARADLYAIGCIFYHCLCGQPPFQGNGLQILGAHLATPPVPLHRLRPDIPPDLDALLLRLLAKDPAQRIQSCTDLIAILDGHAASVPMVRGAEETTIPSVLPGAVTIVGANRSDQAGAAARPTCGVHARLPHGMGVGEIPAARAPGPLPQATDSRASWNPAGEVAPRGRTTAGKLVLWSAVGLLLTGLLVATALWGAEEHPVDVSAAIDVAEGIATPAVPEETTPAPDDEPVPDERHRAFDALLAEAEQAATDEDWPRALKRLARASILDIEDHTRARRAQALAEHVQEELQNQVRFERFRTAVLLNDVPAMATHHANLPAPSVYRGKADQMRDQWAADMLARVRASSPGKACAPLSAAGDAASSLDQLFPAGHEGAGKLRAACAGKKAKPPAASASEVE